MNGKLLMGADTSRHSISIKQYHPPLSTLNKANAIYLTPFQSLMHSSKGVFKRFIIKLVLSQIP